MAEAGQVTGTGSEERKRLRESLIDQLRHLTREVERVEGVIGRVPEKLLAEKPPNAALSIKETFGLLARLDEAVHPERIARIVEEHTPRFEPADPEALLSETAWREQPIKAILERVHRAREELAGVFEATPPDDWLRSGIFPEEALFAAGDASPAEAPPGRSALQEGEVEKRDLYWMAHALCQYDAARLRAMTRRLHESHFEMDRPEG